jgi:mono/diheme cytochrome c family protein
VQEFTAEDIEEVRATGLSSMPTGLADQLAGRPLDDLIRFLIELRDGGPERADELRPSAVAVHLPIAEYESQIDHAALIQTATAEVLQEGAAIYARVCANCHGTLSEAGSLPHSLRFAEGKFKNGSDPYSLYRTLTYGFGMMTPQPWMVPRQKYAVIHYLREHYLRERNRSQWSEVTEAYLAALPKGDSLGPEPSRIDPWNSMDYGPALTHTYQISSEPLNIAYKGIAIRLDAGVGGVARGDHWTIFDTDTLRWAAGWQAADAKNRFIDWRGIQFNGQHNIHPRIEGEVVFANGNGPGWANPANLSFADDSRVVGRDDRRYGPLPRDWGKFIGQYRWGNSVVVAYRIGGTPVHEIPGRLPAVAESHGSVFLRTLWLGPRSQDLLLQVADWSGSAKGLRVGYRSTQDFLEWENNGRALMLRVKAGGPFQFQLGIAADQRPAVKDSPRAALDLPLAEGTLPDSSWPWLRGGPAAWTVPIQTATSRTGRATDPFLVETLNVPSSNPWSAQMRCTGLDFFSDGSLAVCTWDGDVWRVSEQPVAADGESGTSVATLLWKRIASGLFQPLGLKIVEDQIYVTCRDQLARLHDLNGDGEIDFYECFNNDHQVTEHFHEFAMGLQRDAQGNFYYAKSARHALKAVVPHHGTLLKVTPDGAGTEIIANGFRAANGVCLNPDGSFFVTDQEGHWNPKNRINRVEPNPGGSPRFYGNLFGYTAVTDSDDSLMEKPLCWITNEFDRSPGELVWVTSDRWGSLQGELLELSYGMGRAFLVLQERVGELSQGGMVALPIPDFPTGVMRGRFHPGDGQLYLCGMFAWAGNAQQPGGLYRIRRTQSPLYLPSRLRVQRSGIELRFMEALRPESVTAENFAIKVWALRRTANYGSKHLDEKPLTVVGAVLDADQRTIHLELPELQPTWGMEIRYRLEAVGGQAVSGKIHNTIHVLGDQ